MLNWHIGLGRGQHLDKLHEVDAPVHVAVRLLHHVGDLLLSKSFPKVQHANPELILGYLPIPISIESSRNENYEYI